MTKHDAERKVKILDYIAATLRARGLSAVGPRDRPGGRAWPRPRPSTTTSRSSSARATSSVAPPSRARSG